MAPDSIFSRTGYFGRCEWALDEGVLTIVPQSLPPEVYALRDISAVGGNAYDIRLRVGADTLNLTRVGADGAAFRIPGRAAREDPEGCPLAQRGILSLHTHGTSREAGYHDHYR
jgi:hypothetical protein